ncbi:peptidoglycan DD-metalloendopeptidase family protein [Streptomyces sp. NPDC003327]
MNDQHPYAGYVGDDAHTTGSFAIDPLFGAYPGGQTDHSGQWDLGQYGTTDHQYAATGTYDAYAPTADPYATTGQWDTSGQWSAPTTPGAYDTGGPYDTTGQWDASAWTEAQATGAYDTAHAGTHAGAYAAQGAYGYESYDTTGQWAAPAFATDTGAYDATAWNHPGDHGEPVEPVEPLVPQQYSPEALYDVEPEHAPEADAPDTAPEYDFASAYTEDGEDAGHYDEGDDESAAPRPAVELRTDEPSAAARPGRRASGGSRSRRRTPAKRSALLTVAVPSACVMGVAGIAAASVSGLTGGAPDGTKDDTTSLAAADPAAVQQIAAANNSFDTQLDALDADARDFGDRASRTQERIDLKVRQAAEKKKREEEAARREALRPKFMLPVKLHQLSARYGQSGVNWMSLHTGIDFPVQYGTPVMAATDGTVRTQWNSAYGNMAIVTAKDGTETWYCHLSSTKIRTGEVKAGEVIAYSGNSGNSTGPHLHFEVRPGGGAAIDPLAWLRSHGLDPTS